MIQRAIVTVLVSLVVCQPVAALDEARRATIFEWIYIGKPDRYATREDVLGSTICVPSDWTAVASGLGGIASDWRVSQLYSTKSSVWAVQQAHIGIEDCILVFSREDFETNEDVVAEAVKFGFVDMTEAIAGLVDNRPAVAAPSGDELSKAAEELFQLTLKRCERSRGDYNAMDCECMAERRRQHTLENPEILLRKKFDEYIPYLFAKRGQLPQECISEEGIRGEIARRLTDRRWTDLQSKLRPEITREAYVNCVSDEFIEAFRAEPSFANRRTEKLSTDASLTCRRRFK